MSDTERKTSWRVQVRYNGARSGAGQTWNGVVFDHCPFEALDFAVFEACRGEAQIVVVGFTVDEVQS